MGISAKDAICQMQDWIGIDKRVIIDIYNSHLPLARGYKVQYYDAWCDPGISALFIKLNAIDAIGGTECGVERHIDLFKAAGIWEENGGVIPEPGWIICYNWDDNTQPNDGWADHIGLVEKVENGQITLIECNYNDQVARRIIPVGWGYIRGYAKPKYNIEETQQREVVTMGRPNGIDVASWQPNNITNDVDYDFVFVKITQGTGYINPLWKKQVDYALNKNKLVYGYHYANGSGVAGEVNFFLQTLGDYIKKIGCALDWETSTDSSGRNSQFTNPGYAKQWLDEVKKRSEKVAFIYGSKDSCFNAMDWGAVAKAKYPCWGAQYGSNNAIYGYQADPWQSSRPWGAFGNIPAIHQYTSNLILSGYGGRLDGNISYLTANQLKEYMAGGKISDIVTPPPTENLDKASLLELTAQVQEGKLGVGENRKRQLGDRYDEVQAMINHIYGASADTLATEVISGKYGTDSLRKRVLGNRYNEVQKIVNQKLAGMKDVTTIAKEVINGKWGNGDDRVKRLRAAGYDSTAVQKEVNRLLGVA